MPKKKRLRLPDDRHPPRGCPLRDAWGSPGTDSTAKILRDQKMRMKAAEYKHPPHRKGKCAICRTKVSSDVVCCAACCEEYFMHADEIIAEDLMREARKQPGFREAVAQFCAMAAIFGPIVLVFKHVRFCRAEYPR